jgi:cellulose synthase/poly-beta-1,6-N-acetylglucosamine synthase-like glycosyltransferase
MRAMKMPTLAGHPPEVFGGPAPRAGAWGDRLWDAAPALTTAALLAIYPLLRYFPKDPFAAEVFRFAFITFWIGSLILSMIRALKTRAAVLAMLEDRWLDRLRAEGRAPAHYLILMPLKGETKRHILYQTLRAVERQEYPRDRITVIPIVEAEDAATRERMEELLPPFAGRLDVRPFVYPAAHLPVRCKATSVTAAGRWLRPQVEAGAFGPDGVRALVVDADTILHPQDLACREHHQQAAEARWLPRGYRAVVLQSLTTYTANYWKVPMLPRLHNTGFVLYQMGRMQAGGNHLILGPGMSLPFEALAAVDYFEPNRHNEDMQFRYKVVMEGYRVVPLRLPTWGQAPLTTRESWGQIARWARGAVDAKFVVRHRRLFPAGWRPLARTKPFLALRALLANAAAPLMVLLPAQLILISWLSPCVRDLWPFPVFLSPDVLALKLGTRSLCVSPMAAFNLRFQTIVLTSSTLLGMLLAPHLLRPIIYGRPPRRWRGGRRFLEWFRLVFTPLNLHNYFLMATAQVYTQARLALGFNITRTDVTRK